MQHDPCLILLFKLVGALVGLGLLGSLATSKPKKQSHYRDAVAILLQLGFFDAERRVREACKRHRDGTLEEIVNTAIRLP